MTSYKIILLLSAISGAHDIVSKFMRRESLIELELHVNVTCAKIFWTMPTFDQPYPFLGKCTH